MPPPSLSRRLEELQECLTLGQLNQQEFAEARSQVLKSFCTPGQTDELDAARTRTETEDDQQPESEDQAVRTTSAYEQLPRRKRSSWSSHPRRSKSTIEAEDEANEDAEQEGHFWLGYILAQKKASPSLRSKPVHHQLDLANLTMADIEIYNMTSVRLHELFQDFDEDGNGEISVEELQQGLEKESLYLERDKVEQMIMKIKKRFGPEGDEMIIREKEFTVLFTRLRLAELFTPKAGTIQFDSFTRQSASQTLAFYCDYSRAEVGQVKKIDLGQTKDEQHFFFGSRSRGDIDGGSSQTVRDVRWVHVDGGDGLDRLTLLRLAVKYHLHPLAIDDIIDNRTPTKLDRFAEYYFLSVDVLTLVTGTKKPNVRVRIHRSNVAIFLSLPPFLDTFLTILQDRPDESSWMAQWRRVDVNDAVSAVEPDYKKLWNKLRDDLEDPRSIRIRERKADFLLYEVLDRIVDQLRPIASAYAARLGYMHQRDAWKFPPEWLDELDEVRLELCDLARSIRPLRPVLRHLVSEKQLSFPKMYLEDVEDNLENMLEDISQLQEMCKTLEDSHEKQVDRRMNSTLYVLSVVTTVFLPCSFVTGLYGMNFVKDDGTPDIPELTWSDGYTYFWKLEFVLLVLAILFFLTLEHGFPSKCLKNGYRRLCSKCHRRSEQRPRRGSGTRYSSMDLFE